jgi:hypothetical protein
MRGVLGDAYAALSLSFAGTRVNLGDTGTGPIKPLIDGLWRCSAAGQATRTTGG